MPSRVRRVLAFTLAFTALLSAAVDSDAQQLHDISGVWTAVAATSEGGRVNRGELHIVQQGNRIEAVSTTGKSAWTGTLTGRKLVADWRAKENAGQLVLVLSADGRTLDGTWTSPKGNGAYRATKSKRSPNY